jgi:hypothetical protein
MRTFAERVAAKATERRADENDRNAARRAVDERNAARVDLLAHFAAEIRSALHRIGGDAAYVSVFGGKDPEFDTAVPEEIRILSVGRADTEEDHVFRIVARVSTENGKADVSVVFLSDDTWTMTAERALSHHQDCSRGYRESLPATLTVTRPNQAAEFIEDMLATYIAANAPPSQGGPGLFGLAFGSPASQVAAGTFGFPAMR